MNPKHRANGRHSRTCHPIAAIVYVVAVMFAVALSLACGVKQSETLLADGPANALVAEHRLPTGARLDPAGHSFPVGNMPIAALASRDARHLVLSLAGWREQGLEIVDRRSDTVVQKLSQPGAFLGLAWSRDGRTLYASGGVTDLVYVYAWNDSSARPAMLTDSISLGDADGKTPGSRYPAGIAVSANGRALYVAENLSDSVAVVDLVTRRVVERVVADAYPYAVVAARDGRVYVSAWGASTVNAYAGDSTGHLVAERSIAVGRHPSALVLNADGTRLFAASASTDRIAVVDTRARRTLRWLRDPPPGDVREGSTPNALALSPDGRRLYVAEADANAVAVFELSAQSSGRACCGIDDARDSLVGRVPTQWYPTAIDLQHDSLWVVNGKGAVSGPNPRGPQPDVRMADLDPRQYTLGQLTGSVTVIPNVHDASFDALSRRVAHANGWDAPRTSSRSQYPPFEHVIYIIKENRTYDQILGDLTSADGDTAFAYFPRSVTPNHHAIAERFGIFDRFFVNAEVSNQGHPWSTSAYVTDFVEKTTPDDYRLVRPEHDDTGGADMPAAGYLWDAAVKKRISVRDYGEYGEADPDEAHRPDSLRTRSLIASLAPYTSPTYPSFNLAIPDQRRADAWIAEFREFERSGKMPALEILHLPNDHTAGAHRGLHTPKALMADNDLALGRIVEAVSKSRFWKSTVIFVVEDDAQDGPDHVDSHRSVLLVASAWNRRGVSHRFVNTTDVLATIEEILGLDALSQFDRFGRPLREIWNAQPDLSSYVALTPTQPLSELNVAIGQGARRSASFDLSRPDQIDDDAFNRVLWRAIKGPHVPFPVQHRASVQEYVRER